MLVPRSGPVCALLLLTAACSWGAETALPREYYVGYSTDAPGLMGDRFSCPHGRVDLRALMEELRQAIDDKLSANHLGDIRDVIDLDAPDEIGAKAIEGQFYVRYLFSQRLSSDVVIPGEGGVILIVRPCSKEVVDAVFFTFP